MGQEARLKALYSYAILDTEAEQCFDDIVEIAATIFKVPIALISLVDVDRQWFKAKCGISAGETPIEQSFCVHSVLTNQRLAVKDATLDPRFQNNPLVTGEPHIRFYAGAPLRTDTGEILGSFCIIDNKPREITESEFRVLELLANRVMDSLNLRKRNYEHETALHELRKTEASLSASESRFIAAIQAMQDGFVIQNADGVIHEFNPRACEILGLTPDQLRGRKSIDPRWKCLREDLSPFPGEEHPAMRAIQTGQPVRDVTMGVQKPDGELVWISINSNPLFNEKKKAHASVTTFCDVTAQFEYRKMSDQYLVSISDLNIRLEMQANELEVSNRQLEELSQRDGLTGLFNHRTFQSHLDKSISENLVTTLILLDVDHFKKYNDAFGHPAGDQVLRDVSKLITEAVRPSDIVCRYGGEEFAVILPGTTAIRASKAAERICEALREYSWPLRAVTASLGVAEARKHSNKSDLIERADKALYASKSNGRDRYTLGQLPQERRKSA